MHGAQILILNTLLLDTLLLDTLLLDTTFNKVLAKTSTKQQQNVNNVNFVSVNNFDKNVISSSWLNVERAKLINNRTVIPWRSGS